MRNPVWGEICSEDRRVYNAIRAVYKKFPDVIDLGNDCSGKPIELSCHLLARGFANTFPQVTCVDGYFSAGFQHSWLTTERYSLIDVYPVATIGGPLLLLNNKPLMPASFLYEENRAVIGSVCEYVGNEQFERAVQIVTGYISHINQ